VCALGFLCFYLQGWLLLYRPALKKGENIMSIQFCGSEVLENGVQQVRLEVVGCTNTRPYDTNSLSYQQVTLTVHPNGVIQPEYHWRYSSCFNNFYPFLEWPSRRVASWEEVLSKIDYKDPSARVFGGPQFNDAPGNRWYSLDSSHEEILWEKWVNKPLKGGSTRPVGFRILRKYFTNSETPGIHEERFELEYNKNTPKKQTWLLVREGTEEEVATKGVALMSVHACAVGTPERHEFLSSVKAAFPEFADNPCLADDWGEKYDVRSTIYPAQNLGDPAAVLEYDELSSECKEFITPTDCE